jgi:hypothetical protein
MRIAVVDFITVSHGDPPSVVSLSDVAKSF